MSSTPSVTPLSSPYFSCIFARDSFNGGIGYNNALPWKFKEDITHFKKVTSYNSEKRMNIVIMGRKTWESMGGKPLPDRINIVVSKTLESNDVIRASSLDEALIKAASFGQRRSIFVIGGVSLYREAFDHPLLESIYETEVKIDSDDIPYDTYFTDFIPPMFEVVDRGYKQIPDEELKSFGCNSARRFSSLTFVQYNRIVNTPEYEYVKLVKEILSDGELRGDRTGTGTMSIFDANLTFDLKDGFPLLTGKMVGLRIVFEELMWMLRGQTNNNTLKRKKVGIWTKNSDNHHRKMITHDENGVSRNPTHSDGDLGELYGYQWRSFGGNYKPLDVNVLEGLSEEERIKIEDTRHIGVDGGVDQIADILHQIRTNPESRRIILSGWNPCVLENICLPACHMMAQFYVSKKKYLHCKLYMRSNDVFLGAPFNVCQYSLLTCMLSAMTGYLPGKLVYSLGDAHIYTNHLEQMKEQILRPLRELPKLKIVNVPEKIEDFEFSDIELTGYNPHPGIKGDMAV